MLCEKCRLFPTDAGSRCCSVCLKTEQVPVPASSNPSPTNPSPFPNGSSSRLVVRTQSNQITGLVVSYSQVEKYESLGKRLLNAIRLKDRWSFDPQVHHLRLKTAQDEFYYVLVFGHLRGNYLFVERQELEIEGTFNKNNQFTARSIKDVGTGVSYKINTLSYGFAITLMSFHLLLASYLSYEMFRYSQNLLVSIIVALAYLVVLFTPKNNNKK